MRKFQRLFKNNNNSIFSIISVSDVNAIRNVSSKILCNWYTVADKTTVSASCVSQRAIIPNDPFDGESQAIRDARNFNEGTRLLSFRPSSSVWRAFHAQFQVVKSVGSYSMPRKLERINNYEPREIKFKESGRTAIQIALTRENGFVKTVTTVNRDEIKEEEPRLLGRFFLFSEL